MKQLKQQQPKRLRSKVEREIARYVRDGQWVFMERIQAVGTLWFCVWNKNRYHSKPYPPDLWVCCLMTGMGYLEWMRCHSDWFIQGEWDEERYAVPIQLTAAGVDALSNRAEYDMEPINGGLIEPGFVVIPLPAAHRQRQFDSQHNEGAPPHRGK